MADHNLENIWAKILRGVRESKNFALFGLLSTLNDVEFVDGQICLHTHNDAEKNMLKQHLETLKNLAGTEVVLVLQDDTIIVHDNQAEIITRLKDLFGDKVEIV